MSYVRDNNVSIQDDLKVFIGKRSEISYMELHKQIVNRKWYLAWDTGEFFVGNQLGKLNRYGGAGTALSKTDIEEIVKNYTATDLSMMRHQLSDALRKYSETNSNVADLREYVDDSMDRMTTDVKQYAIDQIYAAMDSIDQLTYSKKAIDEKIAVLAEADESMSKKYDDALGGMATTSYVDGNSLRIRTGKDLADIIASKSGSGHFMCVSDYIDSNDARLSFEAGHVYYVSNGEFNDFTPAISGGGGGTASSITLMNGGRTSVLLKTGSSFADGEWTFSLSPNDSIVTGTLTLLYNSQVKMQGIQISAKRFAYKPTLTDLMDGTYTFTLRGYSRSNEMIAGDFSVNVIGPIYYGVMGAYVSASDSSAVTQLTEKLQTSPAGVYEFTIDDDGVDHYAWICVPKSMNVNSFTMNGFTAVFNAPIETTCKLGNITEPYKLYRSNQALVPGTYRITVA